MMNAKQYVAFLRQCYAPTADDRAAIRDAHVRYGKLRAKQLNDPEIARVYEDSAGLPDAQVSIFSDHILPFLKPSLPNEIQSRVDDIALAVLPTRSVNACAARSPSGEPFIIIDSGLPMMMSFYFEIKAVMFALMRAKGKEAVDKYVADAYRFVIRYYARGGNLPFPDPHTDVVVPQALMASALSMTVAVETFVLAHEFAHIYAGHLDNSVTTKHALPSSKSVDVDFYQMSWEQEYEADALGWDWYRTAWRNNPITAHYEVPEAETIPLMLFEYIALIETNTEKHSPYTTHPPGTHRLATLVKRIHDHSDEQTLEQAIGLARIAVNMPKL